MYEFEQKLSDLWPAHDWHDLTILLAVSGGGDSVALLRAICAIRKASVQKLTGQVIVAHFNHQLRGDQSDQDAHFVASLCNELKVDCLLGKTDELVSSQKPSNQGEGLEALARHARYNFLEETAAKVGARYLVTAHTFDDQVETVLHRILRGTGLKGLGGIARARRLNDSLTILRPMLDIRREEILTYLSDLAQPFCHDESNTDQTFTRNRLRHDLLPLLREQYNPAVDEALVRVAQLAKENQVFLDLTLDELTQNCLKETAPNVVVIQREPLRHVSSYLIRQWMIWLWSEQNWPQQAMGYQQWDRLAALIKGDSSPNPQVAMPGGISIEITPQTITIDRRSH